MIARKDPRSKNWNGELLTDAWSKYSYVAITKHSIVELNIASWGNVVYCLIIVLMKADTSFPLLQSSSDFVNKQLKLRNNDVNILTKANR